MQDATETTQDEATPSAESDEPSVSVYTQEDLDKKVAERHSTLDKQIAEQSRLINLGGLAGQELEKAKALNKEQANQIEELVSNKDIDVAKLMTEHKARVAEFEAHKRASDWEELGRTEEKQAMDRMSMFLYATKVSKEQNVSFDALIAAEPKTPEDVDRQAKVISMVTPTPTMKIDSSLGTGASADFSSMSAEEKIRYGVEHPKKK